MGKRYEVSPLGLLRDTYNAYRKLWEINSYNN